MRFSLVLRWSFALLCATPLLAAEPAPPPPVVPATPPTRAERIVEYLLDAKLDPEKKTVRGRETIRWTNPSDDAVTELRFHLYLNAFKNSHTSFLRESGGHFRWTEKDEGGWGAIDVEKLTGPGGIDLATKARFESPDDGNPDDQTVWVVPLPTPIPPHGSIELQAEFLSSLPKVVARTGWWGDFFLVGQWFPKLAVYEPAGLRGRRRGGWNAHQFHLNSEFYADYGRFDVTLHYPNRFVVGASGACVATSDQGTERTTRFVAEDVHDFAWTAWPRFHVVRDRFDPARDVPAAWLAEAKTNLGLGDADLALRPVEITYLEVPGREGHRPSQVAALKAAIAWLGLRFGAYPYSTITLVDVPRGAIEAGGMEYPTFITAAGLTAWNSAAWHGGRSFAVETTVHEFAHQYFYGLVGSNEFEEAWMDEGMTTWATSRVLDALPRSTRGGGWMESLLPGSVTTRAGYSSSPGLDPLERWSWEYSSTGSYYSKSYSKTDVVFQQLRGTLGAARFDRAMRAYSSRWRYRHPSADDFRAVLEEYAGTSLDREWDDLVLGSGWVDYEVRSFHVSKDRPEGLFDRPGGRVELPEKEKKKDEKGKADDEDDDAPWVADVLVRNRGTLAIPVTVRFVFRSDGKEEYLDRSWDGEGEWVRYRVSARWKLDRVEVDPERKNLLDVNRTNDSWRTRSNRTAAVKAAQWIFLACGGALGWIGGLLL